MTVTTVAATTPADTETLDGLILADLQGVLDAIEKDLTFDRDNYHRLRFLASKFDEACPYAKYWAAKQVMTYKVTQH